MTMQGTPEPWVIRKRGMFYRANRQGYTNNIEAAGIYTREEAEAEARVEASITAHPMAEFCAELQRNFDRARDALTKLDARCVVCGKFVAAKDQDEHLRSQHLGPHYFYFNTRPYRTEHPSMRCGELVKLLDAHTDRSVYEERDGKRIDYGHCDAIDLTHVPQLFTDVSATMHKDLP